MYLVYRCLDGHPAPTSLPPELIPPSKRLGQHAALKDSSQKSAANSNSLYQEPKTVSSNGKTHPENLNVSKDVLSINSTPNTSSNKSNKNDNADSFNDTTKPQETSQTPIPDNGKSNGSNAEPAVLQAKNSQVSDGKSPATDDSSSLKQISKTSREQLASTTRKVQSTDWIVSAEEQRTYIPFFKVLCQPNVS